MKKILNKKLYDFFKNNGLTEIKYPVTQFDANFQYPSTRSGYQYCFSVSDCKIILYLFKGDDSNYEDWNFQGFVDYFDQPIIKLHRIMKSQYDDFEGSIKFLERCVDTFRLIDSLPREEDIEDLLIYLEDDGVKIENIYYGFQDPDSELNFYTIPDVDSGNINICVTLNASGSKTIEQIKKLIESCMGRSKFYFGDSYDKFLGWELKLTSWDQPYIILKFKNNI